MLTDRHAGSNMTEELCASFLDAHRGSAACLAIEADEPTQWERRSGRYTARIHSAVSGPCTPTPPRCSVDTVYYLFAVEESMSTLPHRGAPGPACHGPAMDGSWPAAGR